MQEHFGNHMNLARIKLMALLLHALCVVQTVSLHKLAAAMPTSLDLRIRYYIRIKQNFWVIRPSTGAKLRAWWLFNDLKLGQEKFHYKLFIIANAYISFSFTK